MSKKDLPKSRFANLGDDEDGTDTSSVSSDTSTPEDSTDLSSSSSMLGANARAAQPNQGWSSGPKIEVNSGNNRSMKGTQRAGNVKAPYLPQSGTFVINAGNNYNKGELQEAGNVSFGNMEPKKMSYPSKNSHQKRSLTDTGSHSRNPKRHGRNDTSEITRRVPEPNASSEINYAHNNHSPSTDPTAAQEPRQGGSSSRRPVDRGDGVAQTITCYNDKGKDQSIVCSDIYDDDDNDDDDSDDV